MATEIFLGLIVTGTSGTPLTVLVIEPDYLLLEKPDGTTAKVKHSAIVQVLSPPPEAQTIQIGDRLRRLPANRTHYPAGWFGKEAQGQPLPDMRPIVADLLGTVTAFTTDGFKVRADDGRIFRVSREAIKTGAWVTVPP